MLLEDYPVSFVNVLVKYMYTAIASDVRAGREPNSYNKY